MSLFIPPEIWEMILESREKDKTIENQNHKIFELEVVLENLRIKYLTQCDECRYFDYQTVYLCPSHECKGCYRRT